jgi:hypothetical protein
MAKDAAHTKRLGAAAVCAAMVDERVMVPALVPQKQF